MPSTPDVSEDTPPIKKTPLRGILKKSSLPDSIEQTVVEVAHGQHIVNESSTTTELATDQAVFSPASTPSAGSLKRRRSLFGENGNQEHTQVSPANKRRVHFSMTDVTLADSTSDEEGDQPTGISSRKRRRISAKDNTSDGTTSQQVQSTPLSASDQSVRRSPRKQPRVDKTNDGSILQVQTTPPSASFSSRFLMRTIKMVQQANNGTNDSNQLLPASDVSSSVENSPQQSDKELDNTQPVYPSLVKCVEPLDTLIPKLSPPSTWYHTFAGVLKTRSVENVGQLASLTEFQIDQLPFRQPKIEVVKKTLRLFEQNRPNSVLGIGSAKPNGNIVSSVPKSPQSETFEKYTVSSFGTNIITQPNMEIVPQEVPVRIQREETTNHNAVLATGPLEHIENNPDPQMVSHSTPIISCQSDGPTYPEQQWPGGLQGTVIEEIANAMVDEDGPRAVQHMLNSEAVHVMIEDGPQERLESLTETVEHTEKVNDQEMESRDTPNTACPSEMVTSSAPQSPDIFQDIVTSEMASGIFNDGAQEGALVISEVSTVKVNEEYPLFQRALEFLGAPDDHSNAMANEDGPQERTLDQPKGVVSPENESPEGYNGNGYESNLEISSTITVDNACQTEAGSLMEISSELPTIFAIQSLKNYSIENLRIISRHLMVCLSNVFDILKNKE